MPGIMPFMARIIFIMPPPDSFFIIDCICSNWVSMRFTSCTCTPAPAAMRRLRVALISSGLARSAGVIESMMPTMRRKEGIINSMTALERRKPEIIKATRKRRIAAGAGVQVQEVNRLLAQ